MYVCSWNALESLPTYIPRKFDLDFFIGVSHHLPHVFQDVLYSPGPQEGRGLFPLCNISYNTT